MKDEMEEQSPQDLRTRTSNFALRIIKLEEMMKYEG